MLGFFGSVCVSELRAESVVPQGQTSEERDPIDAAIESFQQRVQMRTLDNGLRVLFYKRGVAPVFAGAVVVRVGGSDELPGHTGVAHMFEHMAFKGTHTIGTVDYKRELKLLEELERIAAKTEGATNFSANFSAASGPDPELDSAKKRWDEINSELRTLWLPDQFTKEYEKRGASGMNATTSAELTSYFVNLPNVSFEFWAAMESARLLQPVLRQFYQERDVVLEERRTRTDDSGEGRLYEQILQTAFKVHPYRNPVIGYPQDISRITGNEALKFRERFYVPENMVISVVGSLEAETVFSTIERYFGHLPTGKVKRNEIPSEPVQTEQRRTTVNFPAEPVTFVAYHKPIYPHPDAIPIIVASDILAGGSSSILHRELVEKRRLVTSIDAAEGPGSAYPNLWFFSFAPRAPHTNAEALSVMHETLNGVTLKAIERQLDSAKRALITEQVAGLESNVSIALDLASTEVIYGSWRAGIEQLAELRRVTAVQVFDVIKRYLVPSNETIATLERARIEPLKEVK